MNIDLINKFFSAIDDIEILPDDSIIIKWKSSVSHEIAGHSIVNASGYNVLKGYQVHFNPDLVNSLENTKLEDLHEEIKKSIDEKNKMIDQKTQSC